TLFPYTTLFRSRGAGDGRHRIDAEGLLLRPFGVRGPVDRAEGNRVVAVPGPVERRSVGLRSAPVDSIRRRGDAAAVVRRGERHRHGAAVPAVLARWSGERGRGHRGRIVGRNRGGRLVRGAESILHLEFGGVHARGSVGVVGDRARRPGCVPDPVVCPIPAELEGRVRGGARGRRGVERDGRIPLRPRRRGDEAGDRSFDQERGHARRGGIVRVQGREVPVLL